MKKSDALRFLRHVPLLAALVTATGTAVAGPNDSVSAELAGHALADFPYFENVRTFNQNEAIDIVVDPSRFPSMQGALCDLYVVEARSEAQWLLDPWLMDARANGPQLVSFPSSGGFASYEVAVDDVNELSGSAGPCFSSVCIGLGHAYDIVLDCDGDAALSAGDFLDGAGSEAGLYVVHDTVQTKLATSCVNYELVSEDFEGFNLERTYAPTNFSQVASCGAGGCLTALPLVILSHGAGHHYDAYDYLQQQLASYGYVVMSLQNTAAYSPTPVDGIADQLLHHVDEFLRILDSAECSTQIQNAAACSGAAQGVGQLNLCNLAGKIDTHRIALVGHSRGGDAIVLAYDRLDPQFPDPFVTSRFNQDDIALLSSLAPVDVHIYYPPLLADPGTKPYHIMLVGGDADVSGEPRPLDKQRMSFQLFDRAHGNRQSVYIHGGAHGWFHEECGSSQPDCLALGPGSVTQAQVHDIVKGYYVPLLKVYLEGNVAGQDFLWRPWSRFRPIGAPDVAIAKEHELGADSARIVIDDYESNKDPEKSSSGAGVSFENVEVFEGDMEDQDCHFDWERSSVDQADGGFPPFPSCPTQMPICPVPCSPYCPPECEDCPPGSGAPSTNSQIPCDFRSGCEFVEHQPMNGTTRSRPDSVSRGAVLQWKIDKGVRSAYYEWALDPVPALAENAYLSLRAAQMPRHPLTAADNGDLDVKIVLRDTQDRSAGVCLSAYGAGIIEPFQRVGPGVYGIYDCDCRRDAPNHLFRCCTPFACNPTLSDPGWQAEFETIRIRLGDFLNDDTGVDLGNLAAIRLEFGACNGSNQGRIAIDDVEFTSPGVEQVPAETCPQVAPCNGQSCLKGSETNDEDTGETACQPASGPTLHCGTGTLHVVTYSCNKAPCCTSTPHCFCPTQCQPGTYLECR